jgi:hypothetical protein
MEVDAKATPGGAAKALAILCLAGFWAMPFAPLAAIGAVKMTEGSAGWARKAAVAGAVLCSAYTLAMAVLIAWLYLLIPA